MCIALRNHLFIFSVLFLLTIHLLSDKCPTQKSSISSSPVRYHYGISSTHIRFFWKNPLGSQGYYSSVFLPMITLDVYRWQASCCYFLQSFRGDDLALSNIFQLLSTVLSLHSNVHLNSPALVCVHRGFDVGHVGSAPLHLKV